MRSWKYKRILPALIGVAVMSASLALGLTWLPAQADDHHTHFVATTGDDQGGANDCTVEANPCATIGHAIATAPADSVIHVAGGTYNEHSLTINKNLTIDGDGAGTTIVDANDLGRVFDVTAGVVTIEDLTVTDGHAFGVGTDAHGGGIHNTGTLTLTDVSITGNLADDHGGGVRSTGMLTMTGGEITNNTATDLGGGIVAGSNIIALTDVVVSGNTGGSIGGGGIVAFGTGTFTVKGGEITNNSTTANGGGIWSNNATLTVGGMGSGEAVTITGNTADGQGDGVFRSANTVIAEGNWWGHLRGPQHITNPNSGTGQEIIGEVDFSPWCADDACSDYHELPAVLAFSVQPTDTTINTSITPAPTVRINGSEGYLAINATNTVALTLSGGATTVLNGTTSKAAADGVVAAFDDLSIGASGTNYQLNATSAPLTAASSSLFNILAVSPDVTTNAATTITTTSATLNGTLDSLGDFTQADVFFRIRLAGSSDPFIETPLLQATTAPSTFAENISDLDPATQYEFAAVVQWQDGGTQEAQGTLLNFTTLAIPPDTATNLQAVAAGADQIDLSWDAPADDGGSPITGYQIERSPNGTDSWTTIVPDTGNTNTTYPNTGLNSNTQYFYRVSATNTAGTGSPSSTASATTDMLAPQPTTNPASDVTQTSATLNGTLDPFGDFTPVDVFFRYRIQGSGDPFIETTPQQMTASGAFSQAITGLDPDKTYEFKTVAQWEDGGTQQQEGSLASFTTLAANTPECGDENNVDCFVNPVTGKNVVLEVDDACTINTAEMKSETDLNVSDPGFEYPIGLMNFALDCGTPGYTTTVTQYYYDVTDDNYILRKHNPNTEIYFTIDDATIARTTLNGQTVTTATYQITDGGNRDIDNEANGIIVDPAGLAISPDDGLSDTGQNIWIPASIAGLLVIVSLVAMRGRRTADFLRP